MKNVKITNMDNGVVIIIPKEQFDLCRTSLSENSVYEFTDQEVTQVKLSNNPRNIELVQKILGGFSHEANRATII